MPKDDARVRRLLGDLENYAEDLRKAAREARGALAKRPEHTVSMVETLLARARGIALAAELAALVAHDYPVYLFTLPDEVVPAARMTQKGKWRSQSAQRSINFNRYLGAAIRETMKAEGWDTLDGVPVTFRLYIVSPKGYRCDLSNQVKQIEDAAQRRPLGRQFKNVDGAGKRRHLRAQLDPHPAIHDDIVVDRLTAERVKGDEPMLLVLVHPKLDANTDPAPDVLFDALRKDLSDD